MLVERIFNKVKIVFEKLNISIKKFFYELPGINLSYILGTNPKDIVLKKIILDDICMPPFLGAKECDDMATILKIIIDLKPQIIFEIGTAYGNTVANILNNHKVSKLYTVNALPEQISGNEITYKLNRNEIGRVYKKYNYSEYVQQIYSNSMDLELNNYFSNPIIDLAIIDGCHDTEFVVNDFLKVEPYLRKDGIIMLHDTQPSMHGHLVGSYVGCMKLRKKGFNIKHLNDTWWGVYIKH